MALFALSGGRIVPAQAVELDGTSATEVLGALRERALDIVGVPLFPIVWEQADRQPGESHLLTMDSAGNTVIVSIRAHFSAVSLFEALSLAGRFSSMSRREIVAMYPGGQAAFDSAWQTFRESSPATASAGARMVVVTLRADDDLFPVITTLSEGPRGARLRFGDPTVSQRGHLPQARRQQHDRRPDRGPQAGRCARGRGGPPGRPGACRAPGGRGQIAGSGPRPPRPLPAARPGRGECDPRAGRRRQADGLRARGDRRQAPPPLTSA